MGTEARGSVPSGAPDDPLTHEGAPDVITLLTQVWRPSLCLPFLIPRTAHVSPGGLAEQLGLPKR